MGKIAFVFAGQGAQKVGMGLDLFENYRVARDLFEMLGEKQKKLLCEGPAEELNITINTQPCLFVLDLACALLLEKHGVKADASAGFSLGEIPALAFCGLMSVKDAFELVNRRAEAMQKAAVENPGTMFAVLKLQPETVGEICDEVGGAFAVNYNCPGQTVVACRQGYEKQLESLVLSKGGRVMKLSVSGGFHSPMMTTAAQVLSDYLSDIAISDMRIPLWSNVTGEPYDPADARTLIARQVVSPVLWQRSIESMMSAGIDTFIEVGPGGVLSGLIRRISPDAKIYNVYDRASLEATVKELIYA